MKDLFPKLYFAPTLFMLLALVVIFPPSAPAADFTFHGDFSHSLRVYSNQSKFFAGDIGYKTSRSAAIADDTVNDTFALFKYRLWTEVSSDNGAVKGVYAVEVGNVHFGDAKKGGGFSGDGVNVETRWAYTDLNLLSCRVRLGLQPVKINKFFWQETAAGVSLKYGNLETAWYRGYEVVSSDSASQDLDAFYLRYNFKPVAGAKMGLFAVWLTSDGLTDGDVATLSAAGEEVPTITGNYAKKMIKYDLDLYTLGIDGGWKAGNLFANWDLMYQFGDLMEAYQFDGYFAHLDLGVKLGHGKLTYTAWYASGDEDNSDGDMDAFIAIDCDTKASISSVVLFEGMTEDTYFSAVPYIQDKGLILNRLGYEHQLSDKLKLGAAALYLMTAEDVEYEQFKDDNIGLEFDCFASYKMFNHLELGIEFGYLFAGDAMDYYETDSDGNADTDLYVVNSKIRYRF